VVAVAVSFSHWAVNKIFAPCNLGLLLVRSAFVDEPPAPALGKNFAGPCLLWTVAGLLVWFGQFVCVLAFGAHYRDLDSTQAVSTIVIFAAFSLSWSTRKTKVPLPPRAFFRGSPPGAVSWV
jgi:hypothetical protein